MSTSPMAPAALPAITVRRCTTHAQLRACVELQVAVWKFDPLDVVSHHILAVAQKTGGHVLGAFDGDRMVGFAQAFAATRDRQVYLHSHMAAVLPEYQSRGIGRLLKLAQRQEALDRGIELIEWTFDPMEARNANFNILHLGAIIRQYIPDFYGPSSSPLHANLPTDRVVAEWWLRSRRVEERLAGHSVPSASDRIVSIPRNFASIRRDQPTRAAEIQAQVRQELMQSFEQHHAVIGFSMTATDGNYHLGTP